ncbi:hypothetical protein BD324DRAFT_682335 [Kockovaella imperatae]|uniref:Uncharacterized protein n=1 Tax=Kockovaella imperatae TaxID=4999 RepID=A0A1Y1UDD3_9TREE|nr:hypothetical protein BD324DRAFT_682335 [Kockovaella imperatae]ORX35557.1 hypothetical protein BD324DRAFT_682335 [Kockovaella imperatae]
MAEGINKKSVPLTHPTHVQDIIAAPLEENDIELFMSNLGDYVNAASVPSIRHIQFLFYLSLFPPAAPLKPSPLFLLKRLLACHSPVTLSVASPVPSYGSQVPVYANWHVDTGIQMERQTMKLLKRCRAGVWDLFWVSVEEEDKVVSDTAWELIGWCVELWEKDQAESEDSFSALFVAQLGGPSPDLAKDNASSIVDITRCAFEESGASLSQMRRIELAARMFALLINATTVSPPRFHPPSLSLTFLPLFRSALGPEHISMFLSILQPRTPHYVLAHIYTIALEELAGCRISRARSRKLRGSTDDFDYSFGALAPPTVTFLLGDLLLLPPRPDQDNRMAVIKLALVGIMLGQYPGAEAWLVSPDTLERLKETNPDSIIITLLQHALH